MKTPNPTPSNNVHLAKVGTVAATPSHQANPAYVTQPATIVSMTKDAVTLSTIGVSHCNQCALRKGCGQRLIIQASQCDKSQITLPYTALQTSHQSTQQIIAPTQTLNVGQRVTLAIPQQTFIQASLWAFLVPMVCLLVGALTTQLFTQHQATIALFAILGLATGIVVMRWRLQSLQDTSAWQPYAVVSTPER